MDLVTPITVGALLALFTAIQAWINKGRFDALQRQIEYQSAEIAQVRSDVSQLRSDFSTEIAQLRSDLLQVVLALTPKTQTG